MRKAASGQSSDGPSPVDTSVLKLHFSIHSQNHYYHISTRMMTQCLQLRLDFLSALFHSA